MALRETRAILAAAGGPVTFMVCDAAVHDVKQVRTIAEAEALMKGGGGSDFSPAFEQLAAMPRPPSVVIAATDGDISVPTEPPPFDVIWLLVDSDHVPTNAYGSVVKVD